MRFRPFKIRYEAEDEKTVVYMHGRDEKGCHRTVKVDGTEPHFFVKAGQGSKLLKQEEERAEELESPCRIMRVEKQAGQCFITEKKLDKVVARFPFDVSKLRELVDKTWEADVVYENRVRYDLGIMADVEVPENCERVHKSKVKAIRPPRPGKGGVRRGGPYDRIRPRWAVYDIEVYDKGGFHGPEDARAPVVSVAAWDSFSERYVCVVNAVLRSVHKTNLTRKFKKEGWKVQTVEVSTEEDLFSTFNKWLKNVKPDMLIGWNSSEYDDDYLKKRAMRIGCERPAFTELVLFDAEDGYIFSKYQRPESSSLHYVATQEFGLEGKSTDMRIWEMMDGPRDELVFYNVSDVFLTKEIVEQSGMLDFYLRLAERAGVNIGRCFSTGHLVDSMVFHRLSGTNRIQPTKPYISKKEKENWGKISGAEVFDPSSGLHENVVELDNKSEYPMIIRTFNISPETIIEPEDWERFDSQTDQWIETPRKNRYRIDVQGIFPELLEELQGDRDAAKAVGDSIGDDVNKKLMNTFYGVMPSPTYRMPDKRIGGDITGLSRAHLLWNKKFVASWNKIGTVLYGDTDSTHILFQNSPKRAEAKEWGAALAEDMNASFKDFAQQFGPVKNVFLKVKVEHLYDKFLQAGKKKKYACLYRDENGDIERDGIKYNIKWRGFEIRRGDAARATKEAQTEVLTEMWRRQKPNHIHGQ